MTRHTPNARAMRELFSYVKRFSGVQFVIRIDDRLNGSAMWELLLADLATVARIGVRLFVVAGARSRIDAFTTRYGVPTQVIDGVRVSRTEALPFIEMAAFDTATKIMSGLTGEGIDAVIGNWVRARTLGVRDGVDFEHTGEVESIDVGHLQRLSREGVIPILPCLGWNHRGDLYNLSSNRLATTLARRIGAAKLIFCRIEDTTLPDRITTHEMPRLLDQASEPRNEEYELAALGLEAATGGVSRVHLINASNDGALLTELFSNVGAGTMIYRDGYRAIRDLRPDEIGALSRLMAPHVDTGRLVPRSREELERRRNEFVVYEIDGTPHGAAALGMVEDRTYQIYGVAVDDSVAEAGVGTALIEFLLDRARSLGARRVFACTTQAFDWFRKLGFSGIAVEALPAPIRDRYDSLRNSRAVVIDLLPMGNSSH